MFFTKSPSSTSTRANELAARKAEIQRLAQRREENFSPVESGSLKEPASVALLRQRRSVGENQRIPLCRDEA